MVTPLHANAILPDQLARHCIQRFELGPPVDVITVAQACGVALQRAGLPPIRTHDLRHSAASLLIALGVPAKEVSEILGHSTIAITANLYGHLLPGAEQRAADKLEAALWDKAKKALGITPGFSHKSVGYS